MTIVYKNNEIVVRGGAWLDPMNSCFYEVIDRLDRFDICREYGSNKVFALPTNN